MQGQSLWVNYSVGYLFENVQETWRLTELYIGIKSRRLRVLRGRLSRLIYKVPPSTFEHGWGASSTFCFGTWQDFF